MDITTVGEIAVRSIHIMASGERADFDALIHPEGVNREAVAEPPACRVVGPAGFYATALWLRTAFPGFVHEIHEVVADGNLVAVHATMCGRHAGPFVNYAASGEVEAVFPPTGQEFATTQSHWFRVRDGKILEHWANRDDLGHAKQAGWIPPSPVYLLRMARAKSRARRAA